MGISPPTRTGGQEEFEKGMEKAMSALGHTIGGGICFFAAVLIIVEVVLNPIFLFAQAKAEGINVGTPFLSLAWWTVVIITFTTTGVQYALLQPGVDKSGIGFKFGLSILVLDTLMDGAGFLALVDGGNLLSLSGDSSRLRWGIFPSEGSTKEVWIGWIVIMVICALHEPFLGLVLGRLTSEPSGKSNVATINISMWTKRAGKIYNRVKLATIAVAPYVMLTLDVMLFPQSAKGQSSVIQFTWLVLTFVVTLTSMVVWEYWNHLRTEGGYKLKDLDLTHQGVFIGALAITVFDSFFDLQGFNEVLFGQDALFPEGLSTASYTQYILTAALVMMMTTAFEPMNSHLFEPLGALASKIPGYGESRD